jgi:hypothetical protein
MNMVAPAMRVKATSRAVASPPTATDSRRFGAANALSPNAREVADRTPKAAACWSLLDRKPAVLVLLLVPALLPAVASGLLSVVVSAWDSD